MKLGHAFEFDMAVEDVARSAGFYESIGFDRIDTAAAPGATRLTDGLIVLALRRGREGTGLTYWCEELAPIIDRLRELRIQMETDQPGDRSTQVRFADPTGLRISVVQGKRGDRPTIPGRAVSTLGQFGEFSLEAADVGRTAEFWRGLGYEPTPYSPGAGAGWESLADGLLMVGIYAIGHTKHLFKSPVLTYFNDDAPQRIQQVKALGVRLAQEIGEPAAPREAVLEAPDGQMLFLFGAG